MLKPESSSGSAAGRKAVTVVLVLVAGAVVVAAIARGSLIAAVAIAGLIIGALNARGNASGPGAAHPVARPMRQSKGWLARLAFRTPFGSFMRSRHEQYLRRLTELFERRQWEAALRETIAIGGAGGGKLGLGVPRRRTSPLRPSIFDQPGGRSVPYGPSLIAHQLVVADHGGSVLLVGRYGEISDIHQLDLATRRVRHWTSIKVKMLLPSFDGSVAMAVDEDGLAFLDVHSAQPRIVWREP